MPFLIHNKQLDNLLDREILPDKDKLSQAEIDRLHRQQAIEKITDIAIVLQRNNALHQNDANNDGQANAD